MFEELDDFTIKVQPELIAKNLSFNQFEPIFIISLSSDVTRSFNKSESCLISKNPHYYFPHWSHKSQIT